MRFYLATLFCIVTWMSSVQANSGPVSNCPCVGLSKTRPRMHLIKDYTIQHEGMCPVEAVVFLMETGKKICSDPNIDWVKKAMQKVDAETTVPPVIEKKDQGSTTAMQKVDAETTVPPVIEKKEQGSTTAMQKVDAETTVPPVIEKKEQGSTTAMQKVDAETTVPPVIEMKEQGSTTAMQKVDTEPMVPPVMEEKEKETSVDITPAASRASKKTKPKRRRTGRRRQRKTTLRRMRGLKKRARA